MKPGMYVFEHKHDRPVRFRTYMTGPGVFGCARVYLGVPGSDRVCPGVPGCARLYHEPEHLVSSQTYNYSGHLDISATLFIFAGAEKPGNTGNALCGIIRQKAMEFAVNH